MKSGYKIPLQYGLLMGFIAIIGFALQQLVPETSITAKIIGLSTSALGALTVYLAVKKHIESEPSSSFFRLIKTALLTGIFAGIILWAYMAIYYYFLSPGAMNILIDKRIRVIEQSNQDLTREKINEITGQFKNYFLYYLFAGTIISQTFIALLAGTVTAVLANPNRTGKI